MKLTLESRIVFLSYHGRHITNTNVQGVLKALEGNLDRPFSRFDAVRYLQRTVGLPYLEGVLPLKYPGILTRLEESGFLERASEDGAPRYTIQYHPKKG